MTVRLCESSEREVQMGNRSSHSNHENEQPKNDDDSKQQAEDTATVVSSAHRSDLQEAVAEGQLSSSTSARRIQTELTENVDGGSKRKAGVVGASKPNKKIKVEATADIELQEKEKVSDEENEGNKAVGIAVEADTITSRKEDANMDMTLAVSFDESPPAVMRASTSPTQTPSSNNKCRKCNKRFGREGCTEGACLQCCQDNACTAHKKSKEQAIWKQQVLEGTSVVQLAASRIRSRVIPKKRFMFTEVGFTYAGDTAVIWNVREYLSHPKWREDAVRKATRRKSRSHRASKASSSVKVSSSKKDRLKRSKRRFDRFIEEQYQKSLTTT